MFGISAGIGGVTRFVVVDLLSDLFPFDSGKGSASVNGTGLRAIFPEGG